MWDIGPFLTLGKIDCIWEREKNEGAAFFFTSVPEFYINPGRLGYAGICSYCIQVTKQKV